MVEPALSGLTQHTGSEVPHRIHGSLIVIIRKTHRPKLDPSLRPLGTGLPAVRHLTDEFGTGQIELSLTELFQTQLIPALQQQPETLVGPLRTG